MTRPLDHYCARCRTALNRWRDNATGDSTYVHAPVNFDSWADGHDPEPVPFAEFTMTDLVMRCDVDTAPPVWSYTFDFSTLTPPVLAFMNPHGPEWALCEPCARMVERRDVGGLLDRAYAPWRGRVDRRTFVAMILPVYKVLLRQRFHRVPINKSTTEG